MVDEELKYENFLNVKEENVGEAKNLSDELNKVSDKVDFDSNDDGGINKQNEPEENYGEKDDDIGSKIKKLLVDNVWTNILLFIMIILFIAIIVKVYRIKNGNSNLENKNSTVKVASTDVNKGNNKKKLNFEKLAVVGEPVLIIDEAERIFFVDGRVYDYDLNLLKTLTPNRKYTHYNLNGKFIYMDNKGLADEPITGFTVYDDKFNPLVKNVYSVDVKINPDVLIIKSANGTRIYNFDLRSYRDYANGYKVLNVRTGSDIYKYVVDYEVNGIKLIDIFDGYFNTKPEIASLPNFDKLVLVYKTGFETGGIKHYHGNKDIYFEVRDGYEKRAKFAGTMNGNKSGKAYFFEDKILILLITKDNKYQICSSNLYPIKLFNDEVVINEEVGKVFVKNGEVYDFDMNLLKKIYDNKKLTPIVINYQVKDEDGFVNTKTRIYYTDDKDYFDNQFRVFNLYDSDFRIIIENISSINVIENKGIEIVKDGKTKLYSFDVWVDVINGK